MEHKSYTNSKYWLGWVKCLMILPTITRNVDGSTMSYWGHHDSWHCCPSIRRSHWWASQQEFSAGIIFWKVDTFARTVVDYLSAGMMFFSTTKSQRQEKFLPWSLLPNFIPHSRRKHSHCYGHLCRLILVLGFLTMMHWYATKEWGVTGTQPDLSSQQSYLPWLL